MAERQSESATAPAPGRRGPGAVPAFVPALVAAALVQAAYFVWVVTTTELVQGRPASDAFNYHEPTIRYFSDTFPVFDLSNYWSATTPLYHMVLGAVAAVGLDARVGLMALAALFTLGLTCLLSISVGRRQGPAATAALVLPLIASFYVLPGGVWLIPDNAAWLGVLSVLLLALRPRFGPVTLVGGGAVLAYLVGVRQIHLWAAGMIWAAAWIGGGSAADQQTNGPAEPTLAQSGAWGLLRLMGAEPKATAVRLGLALLATLPAFLIVGWFVAEWGGLIVPRYQGKYTGLNPTAPVFHLAVIGSLGLLLCGWWGPGLWKLVRAKPHTTFGLIAAALVFAVIVPTTYDPDAGRKSGLWNVAARFPEIAGHTSPVIVVSAGLGMATLLGFWSGMGRRSVLITAAGVAGFVAAQSVSPELWQRYHEPFVLVMLAVLASLQVRSGGVVGLARVVGGLVLSAGFLGLTVIKTLEDEPVPAVTLGAIERSLEAEPVPGYDPVVPTRSPDEVGDPPPSARWEPGG